MSKGKKVVWFSQHPPLENQITELKRLFGEGTEVIQHPKIFTDANEIVKIYKKMKGDEMVVVAPLSVLDRLCRLGLHPLWAEMKKVPTKEAQVVAKGRGYNFIKFKRIKKLKLEFFDEI